MRGCSSRVSLLRGWLLGPRTGRPGSDKGRQDFSWRPLSVRRRSPLAGVLPELPEVEEQVVRRATAAEHQVRIADQVAPFSVAPEVVVGEAGDPVADGE